MPTSTETTLKESAELWDRPHIQYTAIAYVWSWALWIGAWLLTEAFEAGEVLFNEDFVWRIFFDGGVAGDLLLVSLIALAAAWGPMVAGIIMSRRDPAIAAGDLGRRIRRFGVAPRIWLTALVVLAIVVAPPLLISVLAMDVSADAPSGGSLLAFLGVFFVVQLFSMTDRW